MNQLIRILVPIAFLAAVSYIGWVALGQPSESEKECPGGECDFQRY